MKVSMVPESNNNKNIKKHLIFVNYRSKLVPKEMKVPEVHEGATLAILLFLHHEMCTCPLIIDTKILYSEFKVSDLK